MNPRIDLSVNSVGTFNFLLDLVDKERRKMQQADPTGWRRAYADNQKMYHSL